MNHPTDIGMLPASISRISRLALIFLTVMAVVGVWLAMIAWRERRLNGAVLTLPPDIQEAAFRRSYEELTTICAREPKLADHCGDEAQFVLRFPQCRSECQELARHYFPVGRK